MLHKPAFSASRQKGWGLIETLLTLGAITALSAGIYMVLKPTSATAQVQREQTNLRDLSSGIDKSWGLLGSFEDVSASRVLNENIAPGRMRSGNALVTGWGTTVSVAAESIQKPNDAFVVTYPSTPSEVCSQLASAVASDVYDLRVGGQSVFTDGALNPASAASRCSNGATMEFVYHSGLATGTAVAAPPLELPVAPPGVTTPTSPPVGAPVGPVGPVGPATPVAPITTPPSVSTPTPAPVAPPAVTPVSPVTPPTPPTPPPVTPPTSPVAACVVPGNTNETQQLNCGAGQYGTIWQSRYATWSCPEAWDAPVRGAFSAWTTTSNTCANCPAPSTQSQTQWVATSGACPAGQAGTQTWEREQVSTRLVSYSCPAGTQTLPGPTFGGWTGWSDTGATRNLGGTCAPVAIAACEIEYSTGTADTSDAYFSISYTINGVGGGCSSSLRDDGPRGSGKCSGTMTQAQWDQVAVLGDTYYESGSTSGWEAGRGEYWGYSNIVWEKRTSCP